LDSRVTQEWLGQRPNRTGLLVEGIVRIGHEVLMEVDDKILLTVGDPQGNLDLHLRPRLIHILNIIIILIINDKLTLQDNFFLN
jgi:hypothetical protein